MFSRKILITGSNGFIGSHLHKALPHADGMSRTASSTTNIIGDILSHNISLDKYDIIYHLAGVVGTEASMKDPINTYKTNICGTINLLTSFKGLFIFLSTVGVDEPSKNPYFFSKYVGEKIVKDAPCEHLIFRIANPYGKGSKSVIQKWLEAEQIRIYGKGDQVRDFVYIDDIVEVLANPLKLQTNKTYNVGTGIPITLNELAKQIAAFAGNKKIEHLPAREFEIHTPRHIEPDIICKTTLKEGLARCLRKSST